MPVTAPLPPHPRDRGPLIGSLPDFAKDFLKTYVDAWHEVGDICRLRGARQMVVLAHPDHVRTVLEERTDVWHRTTNVVEGLAPVMGGGLYVAPDHAARTTRAAVVPLLSAAALEPRRAVVAGAVAATLERLGRADGGRVDMQEEMLVTAVQIACAVLCGDDGPDPRAVLADLHPAIDHAAFMTLMPFTPPRALLPAHHRARAAVARLQEQFAAAVRARRARARDDLLSAMIAALPDASDEQVRDEALVTLFGAYKGIGVGLTGLWYLLGTHAAARDRVEAEAAAPVADGTGTTYTRAVLAESLRLHPPMWLFTREADEDQELGGYRIKAGTAVLCVPWITHRHPAFWERPDAFEPERFLGASAEGRHPWAWFPFGGGPRGCPGDHLGLLALETVVAQVAARFRLDPLPGFQVRQGMDFMLRLPGGLPMAVTARPR